MNCLRWGASAITREEVQDKRVIEVGSYDVNGSLRYVVKPYGPAEYIGVDIVEGPGVDRICPADRLVEEFGKDSFDLVISTCCLEHIKDWKSAVSNMKNICKPGGVLALIVPSRWPFHAYPYDFWRYSLDDVKEIFSDFTLASINEDSDSQSLVYAKLVKPVAFQEKELNGYKLFSVLANRRVAEVSEKDLNSLYVKRQVLKGKIKDLVFKMGKSVYTKI